jgi:hypothetical protein
MSINQARLVGVGGYLVGWMTALAWHFGAPLIVYVPMSTLALCALSLWLFGKRKASR